MAHDEAQPEASQASGAPAVRSEPGGKGGSDGPKNVTTDLRLFEKALAQNWEVPDAVKAAAVADMEAVIANPKAPFRARTTAVRLLLSMTSSNLQMIQTASNVRLADDISRRVDALESAVTDRPVLPSPDEDHTDVGGV
jgi:hypothetical protein